MTPREYKKKRDALGLTQPELAERLGVSRATIARREALPRPGEPPRITREMEITINALAKRPPKR